MSSVSTELKLLLISSRGRSLLCFRCVRRRTFAQRLHQRLDRSTTQWDHLFIFFFRFFLFFLRTLFPYLGTSLACISMLVLYSMARRLLFPSSLDPGSKYRCVLVLGPGQSIVIQDVRQNLTTRWLFDFVSRSCIYLLLHLYIHLWPLREYTWPNTFVSKSISSHSSTFHCVSGISLSSHQETLCPSIIQRH